MKSHTKDRKRLTTSFTCGIIFFHISTLSCYITIILILPLTSIYMEYSIENFPSAKHYLECPSGISLLPNNIWNIPSGIWLLPTINWNNPSENITSVRYNSGWSIDICRSFPTSLNITLQNMFLFAYDKPNVQIH